MSSPLRQLPYIRLYRVGTTKIYSPGTPDYPITPTTPNSKVSTLSGVQMVTTYSSGGGPPDTFVVGTTLPVLVDPLNPQPTDNVGWTGDTSGGTFTTLQTIPAGATRKGCVFNCDVIAGAGVSFEDCMFHGGPPITSRGGCLTVNSGANFLRCTFYGTAASLAYYRNGINHGAGTLNVTRCAFYRWVDMIHSNGGIVNTAGNLSDRFAYFNNDADHANSSPPSWTHNDFVQHLAGAGPHTHKGDLIWSRFETAGVVWSGGTPGSGTASGGDIGMPSTPLNAGYWNVNVGGVYGNGFMFSNVSGFTATITDCWIEGGNNSSSLMSFTTGTTNNVTALRNKFGIGGYRTAQVRYLASWPTGTTTNTGTGADVNVYAPHSVFPSVPTSLQGTPVTVTSGGMRYTAP